jgi:hypothetical protein
MIFLKFSAVKTVLQSSLHLKNIATDSDSLSSDLGLTPLTTLFELLNSLDWSASTTPGTIENELSCIFFRFSLTKLLTAYSTS